MQGNDTPVAIHCLAIRVATLAADGTTPAGNSMYITDSLVKIDFNPEIEAGPETITRNAAGRLCVVWKQPDVIKRHGISIQVCSQDPELEQLLTGGQLYVTGGTIQGYQYPKLNADPVPNGISLEAWCHALTGTQISATRPYMRWVFPYMFNLHKTNRTISEVPVVSAYDGKAGENANWGNGPNNDFPFDSTSAIQWTREVSFPTPQVGALVVPAQV